MLLVEVDKIKKYFGDRLLLDIEELKIYDTDRIGIVGVNGAGKTTLMDILSQRMLPDEGIVKINGRYSYVSQLAQPEHDTISEEMASKFAVSAKWNDTMSGGEKTRFKIAQAFSDHSMLLFADEPTSNVDVEGIGLLENRLLEYSGGLVIISHDRRFLDQLCNKILEIEDGKVREYTGNYSQYALQKQAEREQERFKYQQYAKEKKRLERAMIELREKSSSTTKTPKRMGNSEARLHKMGNQRAKSALDGAKKSLESRINHLQVSEKPKELDTIQLRVPEASHLHSKVVIEGTKLNKGFSGKVLFRDANFFVRNRAKVALIGKNGCGKSTLLKMIFDHQRQGEVIRVAAGVKIGYFSQEFDILRHDSSILENVMDTSIYPETFARMFLARLLFKGDDIYKKVRVLSGGERVKVSFAKILLQDFNVLILDEPTNYLDLYSLEVIEQALREYDRTLLFVSHDRGFIHNVADHIMTIEDQQIRMFTGSYEEYLVKQNEKSKGKQTGAENSTADIEMQLMIMQNRLSDVVGKLSTTTKKDDLGLLDEEYHKLLTEIKQLRAKLSP